MASHHQHNLKKFLTVSLESKKLIPAENAPLPQLDRGTAFGSLAVCLVGVCLGRMIARVMVGQS